MNKLFIIGNLTKTPELRTTTQGKSVCNMTVAVNRRRKVEGQPDADYFRVTVWDGQAESCAKYLDKGRKVAVTGTVSVKTYQASDGTTRADLVVNGDEVEFLSPKGEATQQPATQPQQNAFMAVETDELPF